MESVKLKKDEEIKARVDGRTKEALGVLADSRHLDMSDIIREALRDFISKHQQPPLRNELNA